MNYGEIEGSSPKKLPSRSNGPVSADLNTGDIEGSQANTRGKGSFAKRAKGTVRDNIGVQDIEGARPGTVQNGRVGCGGRTEIEESDEPDSAGVPGIGENTGEPETGRGVCRAVERTPREEDQH